MQLGGGVVFFLFGISYSYMTPEEAAQADWAAWASIGGLLILLAGVALLGVSNKLHERKDKK